MGIRQPEGSLVKILVVDDDRDFIKDFQNAVVSEDRLRDCEFLYSHDGDDALSQYKKDHPQVIVLDMMLPKRSGFLVLEKIRQGKALTEPPCVIMVTGNQGIRQRTYAESLGVSDYFLKVYADDIEKKANFYMSVSWMDKVLKSVVRAVEGL